MKITKRLAMLVIALTLTFLPASVAPPQDADGAVFRALLARFCRSEDSRSTIVTDRPFDSTVVEKVTAYVRGVTIEDFPRPSLTRSDWPHLAPCDEIRVVDGNALATAASLGIRPGTSGFYVRFPGAQGVLTLSRPVYSANGKRALVYEVLQCGVLCGSGGLVELAWKDGEWSIAKYHPHWIS